MRKWKDIAVIACHLKVPEADSAALFHENLLNKKVSMTEFPDETGQASADWRGIRGIIDDYDCFDAEFFGFSDSEATFMDPQHRLLLECAWQALELAGYTPGELAAKTSVFASCSANFKHLLSVLPYSDADAVSTYSHLLGNDKDFIATRMAHLLDCRGQSFTVQSGCSSSLLSVHLACQALQTEQCEMALAASASLPLPMLTGYEAIEGMIFSPTGVCRPYDKDADGTLSGTGACVMVLKPLELAERDGDDIWAVIKGGAVNNDGKSKMNFTAPSIDQQIAVMEEALASANIGADTVNIIEGHGTGTLLGDAIELTALDEVYGQTEGSPCYLGSVKANIGHLDSASGLVGLTKVVMGLREGIIYPQPNIAELNEEIDHDTSRLNVTQSPITLESGTVSHAAISSLGIGGTNVHLILSNHLASSASLRSEDQDRQQIKTIFKKTRYPSPCEAKQTVTIVPEKKQEPPIIENETVVALQDTWQKVLGQKTIPWETDNFFEMGGNSLLAVQLAHGLSKALPVAITAADIYDNTTYGELASLIQSLLQNQTATKDEVSDWYEFAFAEL